MERRDIYIIVKQDTGYLVANQNYLSRVSPADLGYLTLLLIFFTLQSPSLLGSLSVLLLYGMYSILHPVLHSRAVWPSHPYLIHSPAARRLSFSIVGTKLVCDLGVAPVIGGHGGTVLPLVVGPFRTPHTAPCSVPTLSKC